jgi:hypothetical protein
MVYVRPAGNGAGTDGDNELWGRNGIIGFLEGQLHVIGDWTGDKQTVRVARRSDELDAESAEVKDNRVQDVHVGLAPVTTAGTDLAEFQGAAEEPASLVVESTGELVGLAIEEKITAASRGEAIVLRVGDGTVRTCLQTFGAEQAAAKVELKRVSVGDDGVRGARLGTFVTADRTLRRIQDRQSPKSVGQRGRLIRVKTRPVTLLVTCLQDFEHGVT